MDLKGWTEKVMSEREGRWVFKYSDGRETGKKRWGGLQAGHLRVDPVAVTQGAQGVKWDQELAEKPQFTCLKDAMTSGGWSRDLFW